MVLRWPKVCIEAIGWDLPEEVVPSSTLEEQLAPTYRALHLAPGQIEALTGIRARRYWPPGTSMADRAAVAGRRALEGAGLAPEDLGCVIYGGVCRDNLEPATACAVAEALGTSPDTLVYDVSNACLGVLSGMIAVANAITLGQIRAGLVVAAESAREIGASTVRALNAHPTMDNLRLSLATMTGGSAAVGVLLTDAEISYRGHRLLGGAALAAPEFHRICRWGPSAGLLGETTNVMSTDASAVLTHGIALGRRTWARFLEVLDWRPRDVDRVVGHQVGAAHREAILDALGIDGDRDISTFETLGNTGSVAVPLTAGLGDSQGLLRAGDRVALLGIGSGLNCVMLGVQW